MILLSLLPCCRLSSIADNFLQLDLEKADISHFLKEILTWHLSRGTWTWDSTNKQSCAFPSLQVLLSTIHYQLFVHYKKKTTFKQGSPSRMLKSVELALWIDWQTLTMLQTACEKKTTEISMQPLRSSIHLCCSFLRWVGNWEWSTAIAGQISSDARALAHATVEGSQLG